MADDPEIVVDPEVKAAFVPDESTPRVDSETRLGEMEPAPGIDNETPESEDRLAALSDDELDTHPRILERIRQREEKVRQTAEAEATRRATLAAESAAVQAQLDGRHVREVARVVEEAMNAGADPIEAATTVLDGWAAQRDGAVAATLRSWAEEIFDKAVGIPKRIIDAQEENRLAFESRRRSAKDYWQNVVRYIGQAYSEVFERPALEKTVREELEAAAKTRELKAAAVARAEQKNPARVNGSVAEGGLGSITTLAEAARRYNLPPDDPEAITHEQYGELRVKLF